MTEVDELISRVREVFAEDIDEIWNFYATKPNDHLTAESQVTARQLVRLRVDCPSLFGDVCDPHSDHVEPTT